MNGVSQKTLKMLKSFHPRRNRDLVEERREDLNHLKTRLGHHKDHKDHKDLKDRSAATSAAVAVMKGITELHVIYPYNYMWLMRHSSSLVVLLLFFFSVF